MYGIVTNYICMSNFQLYYSPSTNLQTSVCMCMCNTTSTPCLAYTQNLITKNIYTAKVENVFTLKTSLNISENVF